MITLTNSNYFSPEAQATHWSVSQFKAFAKCEACGLAEVLGNYERELTDSLLIGSYVDAYFSGSLDEFIGEYGDVMYTKKGELLAKYKHANDIIDRIEADDLMMEYLGFKNNQVVERQAIRVEHLFDVDWKIKIDVLHEDKIVDLKIVKDFAPIYEDGFGMRSWIEYWGYDIQGAVYQKIEQIGADRDEPLPFYIVAATKEKEPDIAIIQIPQHVLDTALAVVEAKIDRFDLIKTGEVDPIRCESCTYCKRTKVLTAPSVYETEAY